MRTTISISVDLELAQELRDEAEKAGVTLSEHVRDVIRTHRDVGRILLDIERKARHRS